MPKMMTTTEVRASDTSGHGFVKVATWIGQKLLCEFVKLALF